MSKALAVMLTLLLVPVPAFAGYVENPPPADWDEVYTAKGK